MVRNTVYVGSDDGYVYALNAATGEKQWAFQTDGAVVSSPAVFGGRVYVGSNDKHVYALDAATGDTVWTFETGGPVRSSPAIDTGIRDIGFRDVMGIGSDDGSVYYLDLETTEELKSVDTGGPVVATPMMYDTVNNLWEAGTGSTDGVAYWWVPGYDSDTGINKLDTEAPVYGSIMAPDFDSENIWYRTNDDGTLFKLFTDAGTKTAWRFETGAGIRTTPAMGTGSVYVGSRTGTVYSVNTDSGDQEWAFETGNKVDSSPAIADGSLYIGSDDTKVYALDTETGERTWAFETGGPVQSSPAVVDGTVYVGSNDHSVYALAEP